MTTKLGKYATRQVPRYTSYPTAVQFHDGVDAALYAQWLRSLDPSQPASLYLHVPFCRQLCWYCACNMKLAARDAPLAQYAATLRQEIDLLAAHLPGRLNLTHLHWGGGTPTALVVDDMERTMDAVRANFDIAEGAELAIESDPRTLTAEMIDCIGRQGFTRASFGVQEFDPTVQAAINRIQPPEMVADSVEGLRARGVSGINFDLIYGLPHQTVDTLLETIRLCVEMRPDRIALFGYAHVPWMAKKQRLIDQAALPGAAERISQAAAAAKALGSYGYQAIGLDHFALPEDGLSIAAANGTLKRNFQGYTTDQATSLLGVGATSIGRTPMGHVQNIAETGAWARAVEAGTLPVAKGYALTADDALRGHVIEALMCVGKVDLDAAASRFDADSTWYADAEEDLVQLEQDGLIARDGTCISVTDEGAALVRVVAAVFDSFHADRPARHAVAV